jgi:xanthine dehydrogenase accessory factor
MEDAMKNYIKHLHQFLTENGSIKTCIALNGDLKGKHLIWEGDRILEGEGDISRWEELLPGLESALPSSIVKLQDEEFYVELITSTPKLIILGGGHVSVPVAQVGKILGFEVTVIDDRPEFTTRERFKDADRLICADYDQAFEELEEYKNTYYVVVTPGHKKDLQCVKHILKRSYSYAGMIGSKTKVARVQRALTEDGYSEEKRQSLHAPIGLPLGGQTPAEIAVSIAAEIVKERNKLPSSVIEEDVMNAILQESEPMIQAMIIDKKGSSPRGNGSRMLVKADGSIRGTIGGGSVEFAAIQKSQAMLAAGESFAVEEYILTDKEGATLGMVCGGIIKVVFEKVV